MKGRSAKGVSAALRAALATALLLFLTSCAPPGPPETSLSVSAPEQAEPLRLSCFINHTWFPIREFSGIIPEEITRQTGITLDVTVAVDESQLGLLIASGKMCDLVYTQNLFGRLSNPQLCYSYDDIMKEYGVQWNIPEELRLNALSYSGDGKLYTVINHYSSTEEWEGVPGVPMIGSLSVRRDILEALGSPEITNFDQLLEVFRRVKEQYPDMIPLTFSAFHRFNCFRGWFGLGTTDFVPGEDGGHRLAIRDDRYREMLSLLNQMYRLGYLTADNFAADNNTSSIPYRSGRAFSFLGCTQDSNVELQAELSRLNPNWVSIELPPLEGAVQIVSDIGWSGTFITKTNPHPKESLEFLRWMFTPEAQRLTQWGREDIDYQLDSDGFPVFSQDMVNSIENGTADEKYNPWFYFGGSATVEAIGRCAVLDWGLYGPAYDPIRESFENQPWIAASLPAEFTPERDAYDRIMACIPSYEAKVILSDTDELFQRNFAEYQETVELLGSGALEEYMSKKIPEARKNYLS